MCSTRFAATSCSACRWASASPTRLPTRLYRRIKANPARRLRIITALSLGKPVGHSELEQHFLAPLVERLFADYPDLDYVQDLRANTLPPNIEVREFFMKTGDYLDNAAAQQGYISTNYTFVARDMAVQGMNVIAQAVAARGEGDGSAPVAVEQPGRDLRGHRALRRARHAAAEGGRDQPQDAVHAQRRRGRAVDVRRRRHRPGGHAHAVRRAQQQGHARRLRDRPACGQPGGRRRHAADRHRLARRRDRAGADRARPPWRRVPPHPRSRCARTASRVAKSIVSTAACTAARRCSSTASCA